MAEYQLTVLKPSAVEELWTELAALLAPGVQFANGEFDVQDLLWMIRSNKAFAAAMLKDGKIELAGVFEVLEYPKKRVLFVLVMGGQGFDVATSQCWDTLQDLARSVEAVASASRPSDVATGVAGAAAVAANSSHSAPDEGAWSQLEAGPAKATQAISRLGWFRLRQSTGTGLA